MLKHLIFQSFLRDLETHKKDSEKTELEQYHVDCWSTCKAIKTSLKKLKIAEECIKQSYKYCPNGYEVAEYIEFHIENYLIRSRSIYDRVLIFTNYLCDIQMAKESVGHLPIITNRKVETAGLKQALKKINKACESYRAKRNGLVHHDKYTDLDLDWLDTVSKARYISNGKIGISNEQTLQKVIGVIEGHLKEFEENTCIISESINDFLDLTVPIYDKYAQKNNKLLKRKKKSFSL
jgi:hypothetical protein